MQNKPTLVVGASPNPDRYAFKATVMLQRYNHTVVAFGPRKGTINNIPITQEWPGNVLFNTVTLYLNPTLQKNYYYLITALKPNRVIFNPGTENPEFYEILKQHNIQVVNACTLVMLATNQY
jgi:predicted CoA-binding protein